MSYAPRKMPTSPHFLFISHSLETGGIETLVVRMANALARSGHHVSVSAPNGPMAEWMDLSVRRLNPAELLAIDAQVLGKPGDQLNIWCSLPTLMVEALPLQRRLWEQQRITSSCTSGIFHPDQWQHHGVGSRSWAQGRFVQAFAETGSIYFMNDASRVAHVARWGAHIGHFPVYRLHIDDLNGTRWKPRPGNALSILSVGRIVPFKSYNYDALSILERLAERGVEVSWTIFGDGEDRKRLTDEAKARGVGNRLTFLGEIAYGALGETFLEHDLFVGMGTAAIEAAVLGMPTILALSNVPDGCYGFMNEVPSDSVAELVPGHTPLDLEATIFRFAAMSPTERINLGMQGRRSAIERTSGEAPPFERMFAHGRSYPTSSAKEMLRARFLYLAQSANQLFRRGRS